MVKFTVTEGNQPRVGVHADELARRPFASTRGWRTAGIAWHRQRAGGGFAAIALVVLLAGTFGIPGVKTLGLAGPVHPISGNLHAAIPTAEIHHLIDPAPGGARAPSAIISSLAHGWWLVNNSTNPPAREWASLSDDPSEQGAILFGGLSEGNIALNDTWMFQQGRWSELCSGTTAPPSCAASPSARWSPATAYDAREGDIVLFGGTTALGSLNDTWVFHNGSWSNVTSAVGPPNGGGEMAYDAADGYILWVAGNGGTWTFSNGSWTHLNPPTYPSARGGEALFYDAAARAVILWGGTNSQTWEFSAGSWTQLNPAASPPAGPPLGDAYDSAFGYGLVFGPKGPLDNSTWTFSNGTWTNESAAVGPATPPTATALSLAYDSTDGYTVALDEVAYKSSPNETWVLRDPLTLNVSASAAVRDVGQSLTYSVAVSGGVRPYAASFPSLPPGCTVPSSFVNTTTVACTLNRTGSFELNVSVTDDAGVSEHLVIPLTVNPDPTASLEAYPNPTTVGIPVGLDAVVSGGTPPAVGNWTITDGTSSRNASLNHTFTVPGSYRATFSGSDSVGFPFAANVTVVVNPGLSLSTEVSRNVTDVGLPVHLNASATGGTAPLAYAWALGDGTSSSVNDTTHAYSSAGTYAPRVWVNDSVGAGGSATVSLRVNPALVMNATANTTLPSVGFPVRFTAVLAGGTAPYTYWWSFGDGGVNRTATATHVFRAVGTQSATLEINDSVGGSRTVRMTVDVVAAGTNTTLPTPSGSSGGTYSWPVVLGAGIVGLLAGVGIGAVLFPAKRVRRDAGTGEAPEPDGKPTQDQDVTSDGDSS